MDLVPNPRYFGRERGVTWYNLASDQYTGLNAITVPGTLRGSLTLLAAVLEQETELQPTEIMSDTPATSLARLYRGHGKDAEARACGTC